ncbi:hypothetical protein ScPMuIL_007418 [Solemya velum]
MLVLMENILHGYMYNGVLAIIVCILVFSSLRSCLPSVLGHEGGSVDDRQYYFKSLSSTPDGINYATAGRTDIPYLQQYCKNLKGSIKGQEGKSRTEYQLKQVHIILTPSERIFDTHPLGSKRDDKSRCSFKPNSDLGHKINSFIETADIYKNVQRYKGAFKNYDLVPSSFPCRVGQLTSAGASGMIEIGEFLSHPYLADREMGKHLGEDHISVFSAVTEHAYQSTTAFLHGLLPEKLFAKTVVRKSLANFCSEESDVMSCHCHKTLSLEENITESLNLDRADFDRHGVKLRGSFYQFLNDLCHSNENSRKNPLAKSDFTHDDVEQFINASGNYVSDFLKKAYMVSFATLYTYPFITSLTKRMKNNDADDKKIFIYMADELFWYAMISSLDVPHVLAPGSRLIFEIYEDGNTGKHYMRTLLNGDVLKNNRTLCSVIPNGDLCLLSDFEQTRRRTFETLFSKNTYENICGG